VSGDVGALLVSLFVMEWGCYVWAGDVKELEFCLFLVFFSARHISSISPRFYFREHAFCYLPLVSILESSSVTLTDFYISFGACMLSPFPPSPRKGGIFPLPIII
jgi:hypothetical protein